MIFGWGFQTTKNWGRVFKEHCSNCKNKVGFELKRITTWFTLFFIPVLPYRTEYLVICPICSHGYEIDKRKFTQLMGAVQRNLSSMNKNQLTAKSSNKKLANGTNPNAKKDFSVSPTPERQEWPTIALGLSKDLEEMGKVFIEDFQNILAKSGMPKKDNLIDLVQTPFKVFELIQSFTCIASNSYFTNEQQEYEFAQLLQAHMFGTKVEDFNEFSSSYQDKDVEEQCKQLIDDVLQLIDGKKEGFDTDSVAKTLIAEAYLFTITIYIATAKNFGDENTTSQLQREYFPDEDEQPAEQSSEEATAEPVGQGKR